MAVVTKQELEDAAEDAQTLEDVTNGTTTVTARLGLQIQSLYQAIQSISSYNDTGAWLTATSYDIKDLADESGTIYIALQAHTSGVFATDYAAGKWGVFQGFEPHKTAHENGGSDEIDVTDLSGQLADVQPSNTANFAMTADNKVLGRLAGTVQEIDATTDGLAMLAAADAAAQRTLLSLGDAALLDVGTVAGTVAAGDDSRFAAGAVLSVDEMIWLQYRENSGTDGVSVSASSWTTIPAATVISNTPSWSHSGGAVTLLAGTYLIEADVNGSLDFVGNISINARARQTTGTPADVAIGEPQRLNDHFGSASKRAPLRGLFTIASTQTIAPQVKIDILTGGGTVRMGRDGNDTQDNVFGDVKIWKVAQ